MGLTAKSPCIVEPCGFEALLDEVFFLGCFGGSRAFAGGLL